MTEDELKELERQATVGISYGHDVKELIAEVRRLREAYTLEEVELAFMARFHDYDTFYDGWMAERELEKFRAALEGVKK